MKKKLDVRLQKKIIYFQYKHGDISEELLKIQRMALTANIFIAKNLFSNSFSLRKPERLPIFFLVHKFFLVAHLNKIQTF